MKNQKIIEKRFKSISDKDFAAMVLLARKALYTIQEEDNNLQEFLSETDLMTSKGIAGTTYNLFMTLVTSAGAYSSDEEDMDSPWVCGPNLEEGLQETVDDKRYEHYSSDEAQYLLNRINNLKN